jgi:hypothetical protein
VSFIVQQILMTSQEDVTPPLPWCGLLLLLLLPLHAGK